VGTFGLYLAVLWNHGQATALEENALPEFDQPAAAETSAFPGIPSESLEAAAVEATDALNEAAEKAATEVEETATEAEKKAEEAVNP